MHLFNDVVSTNAMTAILIILTGFRFFLPRDAMHKRGLCRHAVSVRLCVHSVKTNKDIFEIFSPSSSHTILVFLYQTSWQYSDGNPPPQRGRPMQAG